MHGTHSTTRRRALAWPAAVMLLLAGLAAILLQQPAIHRPSLLVVLVVLELIVYLCDLKPLPNWQVDAGFGVSLVALVFCGPLAAFLVFASPEPLRHVVERRMPNPPRWIATVANSASFAVGEALAYLALTSIRHPGGPLDAWPVYAFAATALLAANVAIVHLILDRLLRRTSWMHAVRVFGSLLPLGFLAAAVVSLETVIGFPALALFAAIACLPGVAIRAITPILAPRAAALTRRGATLRYARALSAQLALGRPERRAVALACGEPRRGPLLRIDRGLFGEPHDIQRIHFELAAADRYRDDARISRETAIVLFAREWANLTAAGTLELSHTAALRCLEGEPRRYSLPVLRAAWRVVDQQPAVARDRACAPSARPLTRRLAALASTLP